MCRLSRTVFTLSVALVLGGCFGMHRTPQGAFTPSVVNLRAVGVAQTIGKGTAAILRSTQDQATVAFQPRKGSPYIVAVTPGRSYLSGDLELAGVPRDVATAMEVVIYRFPSTQHKSMVVFYQDGDVTYTTSHLNYVTVPELLTASSNGGPLSLTVERVEGGLAKLVAMKAR